MEFNKKKQYWRLRLMSGGAKPTYINPTVKHTQSPAFEEKNISIGKKK